MEEEKQSGWNKIGTILWRMIFNVLYNSFFIWMAVNLFTTAFRINGYLSFTQSIAVCFLYMTICSVFLGKS